MLQLPSGLKLRKEIINKMDSWFEPDDLFIKLSWLPVNCPAESKVPPSFSVAVFAQQVKGLIDEIYINMQSERGLDDQLKFIVYFEYGSNEYIHAFILHENCDADKHLSYYDIDWYAEKWYEVSALYDTEVDCVGNITDVPLLLTNTIGINSKKRTFYITEELTHPNVNTNYKGTGFVVNTLSKRYKPYLQFINAA